MTGDYSQTRYDPRRGHAALRMQQGRVALDSDWNAQSAILARRQRAETLDTTGRSGVPMETPWAFRIGVLSAPRRLTIGTGRLYLDGLLVENFPANGTTLGPLAEPTATTTTNYAAQPFWPVPDALPAGDGPHLAYLDVWLREVTAVEDPSLLEKALGGVDTTTRQQLAWQVRVLANVGEDVTAATPPASIPGWAARTAPAAGRLTTRLAAEPAVTNHCLIPASGGYGGLENQLYRIEIITGGPVGTARFAWSRDNATVAARIEEVIAPDVLTLSSTGRDALLRFNAGDWIEVTDDRRDLGQQSGLMRQIRSVDHDSRRIVLTAPLPSALLPSGIGADTLTARNSRIRRWDQSGQVRNSAGTVLANLDGPGSDGLIPVPPSGMAVVLEAGIEVLFDLVAAGGVFRPGEYWCFAARSIDASIDILDDAPPLGPHHHYAPLALIRFPGDAIDQRRPLLPRIGRIEVAAAVHADPIGRRSLLVPGEELPLAALGNGIEVLIRQQVTMASVNDASLLVTVDLPYQTGIVTYGLPQTLGSIPVTLPGEVSLTGPGRLRWRAGAETIEALGQMLARGVPRPGNARFDTAFEAFNNGQDARWQVGVGNVLVQAGSGAFTPGNQQPLPMLAIAREAMRSAPMFVNLTVSQPVGRTCGLVYNFQSPRDFSIFYGTHQWRPVGFSGAVSVVTMGVIDVRSGIPGNPREVPVATTGSDPAAYTLDLRGSADGIIFGASVRFRSGETVSRSQLDLAGTPFLPNTRLGVADRRGPANLAAQQPSFDRLVAVHGDRSSQVLIPLGSAPRLLGRVVLKRALLALDDPFAFPPPVPEADFETAFWLSGEPGAYGYGYGGDWQGIGAGLLLRG
ncbi:DUF6519 domain-containing protein [Humitalea sp. 24SJ18S-53]|uniref:DUF6519 domain-containing protein n=1 Tax=Humitalea sp. 24SJ18S-53 TaxID=3422307 RepID=UPI003D6720D7